MRGNTQLYGYAYVGLIMPWLIQTLVLSPIFFNISMKVLGQIIWNFGIRCHQCINYTSSYQAEPEMLWKFELMLRSCDIHLDEMKQAQIKSYQ